MKEIYFDNSATTRVLDSVKAVSYTHLDVYKRQSQNYAEVGRNSRTAGGEDKNLPADSCRVCSGEKFPPAGGYH